MLVVYSKNKTFTSIIWCCAQVHISAEGIPSAADATIVSENVTLSLFDVFLGLGPVSPTLKASFSYGLASSLK